MDDFDFYIDDFVFEHGILIYYKINIIFHVLVHFIIINKPRVNF